MHKNIVTHLVKVTIKRYNVTVKRYIVQTCNTEKEIEKEIEKDIDKEKESKRKNLYFAIAKSFTHSKPF